MNTPPIGGVSPERAALRTSAVEFEGLFLEMLMKSMRASVPEQGLINGGRGEAVFRRMQDAEMAQRMAGRFGIAEMIERALDVRA
ncbi:MAG: rod-binding protein [Candidatus Brocadiae bacterium]|nr:rod-binding protein [Candidatus Brocadiia bacterium]